MAWGRHEDGRAAIGPEGAKALLDMGAIKCVRSARKGVPALYRWNLPRSLSPMRGGEGDIGLPTEIGRPFGGLS